jgi:putative acetyltransferase
MIKIISVTKKDIRLIELVKQLDFELNSRYGLLQSQYDQFNQLDFIDNAVIALNNGEPVGCGCYKAFDNQAIEIKRMFVKSEYRGLGVSKQILDELEQLSISKGFIKSILETGIKQPEAIRFYSKLGYKRIDNFGQYVDNENSVCMSKELIKQ